MGNIERPIITFDALDAHISDHPPSKITPEETPREVYRDMRTLAPEGSTPEQLEAAMRQAGQLYQAREETGSKSQSDQSGNV